MKFFHITGLNGLRKCKAAGPSEKFSIPVVFVIVEYDVSTRTFDGYFKVGRWRITVLQKNDEGD